MGGAGPATWQLRGESMATQTQIRHTRVVQGARPMHQRDLSPTSLPPQPPCLQPRGCSGRAPPTPTSRPPRPPTPAPPHSTPPLAAPPRAVLGQRVRVRRRVAAHGHARRRLQHHGLPRAAGGGAAALGWPCASGPWLALGAHGFLARMAGGAGGSCGAWGPVGAWPGSFADTSPPDRLAQAASSLGGGPGAAGTGGTSPRSRLFASLSVLSKTTVELPYN